MKTTCLEFCKNPYQNTLRHANATALDVLLIKRDFSIILRIVDNGVGFDV